MKKKPNEKRVAERYICDVKAKSVGKKSIQNATFSVINTTTSKWTNKQPCWSAISEFQITPNLLSVYFVAFIVILSDVVFLCVPYFYSSMTEANSMLTHTQFVRLLHSLSLSMFLPLSLSLSFPLAHSLAISIILC